MPRLEFADNEPTFDAPSGGAELADIDQDALLADAVLRGLAFASKSEHHRRGRLVLGPEEQKTRRATLDGVRESIFRGTD